MFHFRTVALVVASLFLASSLVLAIEGSAESGDSTLDLPPAIPEVVLTPSLKGDLKATRKALADVMQSAGAADGLWRFVDALSLEKLGNLEEARTALLRLESDLPDGPYAAKARFARARVLGSLGRHADAAAILGSAARELGSESRRDELATTLMQLADELQSQAGSQIVDQNLARQRAIAVLEEALQLFPSDAVTLDLHRRLAQLANILDQAALDASHLTAFIALATKLPSGTITSLELDTARLDLAAALGKATQTDEAIKLYQRFPLDSRTQAPALLARAERQLARALVTRGRFDDRLDAEELLTTYLDTRPDAAERVPVAVELAKLTASMGHDASDAWRQVITTKPGLAEEAESAAMQIRSAWASLGKSQQSAENFEDASETFRTYVARYPDGPEWADCQAAIVKIELEIASNFRSDENFAAARDAWRSYLAAHPLSSDAVAVARAIADSFADEADLLEDATSAKPLFMTSIEELERLVQKNPGTNDASQALVRIGSLYETRLSDLDGAIDAWTRCTYGSGQSQASRYLARLQNKALSVETARVQRTNEPATVQLTTRNLESVEVELYRLDLESYFRRHGGYAGIDDLDLDLIQADHVFTHTIQAPSQHSQVREQLALPAELVNGPGTWVVSILSDTERATTLLLISDLDVILETHGDDAVVFAEDMLQEQPAAGVAVLVVQDGNVNVGETDASGLVRFSLVSGTADLSLIALRDGHAASLGLGKVAESGRAHGPAGFVYTDRGVYRAGETVHWKAILRSRSTKGNLYYKEGRQFDVNVRTPGGVSLFSGVMALGPFGTLFGDVTLPASAPIGNYDISIEDGARHQSGSFEVREFAVPKTRLAVEALRPIVLPGESQTLAITASYAHGAPFVGGRIAGSIHGGNVLEYDDLVTDENGQVSIKLSPKDLARLGDSETPSYSFMLNGDAKVTGRFFRAGRELVLGLETQRALYLAGEAFGVNVSAHDVFGDATARDASLTVIKYETNRQGARFETTLESHDVHTDAEGHARVELRLGEGGSYGLRLSGKDSLGQPVASEMNLEVAPKDDTVELRFLADATRFELGDQVALRLHNNGPAGPALVTRLGRGILHHEIVQLVPGDNTLHFTASIAEAPSAAVRVSRMHATSLHTASQRVEVTRGLEISIVTQKDSYKPGELAEVKLLVTDKHGHPVRTELSLGLVDASFYEFFPERYTNLAASFPLGDPLGQLGPVGSSTSFSYRTATRPISAALLAEQARQDRLSAFESRASKGRLFLSSAEGTFRGPGDSIPPAAKLAAFESQSFNDVIGVGGGAGGKFGGRHGGSRALFGAGSSAAQLDPALDSPTRFWAAAIVTDEDGHAKLRIEMPKNGGRWRFTARAVDTTSRVGEIKKDVITSADFLVQLATPTSLYGGDTVTPEARVFWSGEGPATAHLVFTSQTQGENAETSSYQVEFDGPGTRTLPLRQVVAGEARGVLLLDLAATLDTGTDDGLPEGEDMARDTRRIDVSPFGLELEALAGGFLSGPLRGQLQLASTSATSRRLDVYVGAGIGAELVEAALGGSPFAPLRMSSPASTLDLAGDLYGASAVLQALEAMGPSSAGQVQLLRRRLAGLTTELILRQEGSGGFGAFPGWNGTVNTNMSESIEVTAMALFALTQADGSVPVSKLAINQATTYLTKKLTTLTAGDEEARAMAQFALVSAGAQGNEQLGGLWRIKSSLSPAAKAYLALAYDLLGRSKQAAELGRELEPLLTRSNGFGSNFCGIWTQDPRTQTGLFLWAMTRALPESSAIKPAAEALLASAPWSRGRVRGPALMGLIEWSQETLAEKAGLRTTVKLVGPDGTVERELRVQRGRAGSSLSFDVPDSWGPAPVEFEINLISDGRRPGDGWQPTWHARLTGFTKDFYQLENSSQSINVTFDTVAPLFDHQPLMTGFSVLGKTTETWNNRVNHLHKGERTRVQVGTWGFLQRSNLVQDKRKSFAERTPFTELTVPLPAGCVLVPGTVNAYGANWWPVANGISFQLSGRSMSVSFQIMATAEGDFRTPPATVRSAMDPSMLGISKAMALTILPSDQENPDTYRATPDEVYDRGMKSDAAGLDDAAWELLLPLFDEYDGLLRADRRLSLTTVLLRQSIVHADQAQIVRFFELLSALDPTYFLTLEDVMAIGDAYVSLGEHEHAQTLFEATLDQRFRKDMVIVGVLDRYASFSAATSLQEELWHDYPDSASVVETRLALTDALLTHAPLAADDVLLAAVGRDYVSLTLEASLFLREFLLIYPDSELASLAGTNLLQAYTSLEDYPRAAAFAGQLADRFDEPRVRDDFRYTRAISLWFTGDEDGALALLDAIAKATYPSGRSTVASANRDLALYLMGQIRHAQGDLVAADALYEKVAAQFPDARELDALFKKRALFVEEVASVKPGEAAKITVSSKGVEEVELQVFPVDLLALYLREGDLEDVAGINLAGITPVLRTTRKLDASIGMRAIETELALEPFEPGAYLVILRGEELFSTGLVVVSDLELFVEEDPATGGVRCEVTRAGAPLDDVDVRVVGSAIPGRFFAGKTDRRGLFKAAGVAGQATVIARAGRKSYAFHRGATQLLQVHPGGAQTGSSDWSLGAGGGGGGDNKDKNTVDWFQNIAGSNSLQIQGRAQSQTDMRRGDQTGIQIQTVK